MQCSWICLIISLLLLLLPTNKEDSFVFMVVFLLLCNISKKLTGKDSKRYKRLYFFCLIISLSHLFTNFPSFSLPLSLSSSHRIHRIEEVPETGPMCDLLWCDPYRADAYPDEVLISFPSLFPLPLSPHPTNNYLTSPKKKQKTKNKKQKKPPNRPQQKEMKQMKVSTAGILMILKKRSSSRPP